MGEYIFDPREQEFAFQFKRPLKPIKMEIKLRFRIRQWFNLQMADEAAINFQNQLY